MVATLAISVLAIASIPTVGEAAIVPPSGAFLDDDQNPHEASIEAVAAAGITTGCADNAFCPDDNVTRGQMAAFLVRAYDLTDTGNAVSPEMRRIHDPVTSTRSSCCCATAGVMPTVIVPPNASTIPAHTFVFLNMVSPVICTERLIDRPQLCGPRSGTR